ncbi:unnamed protein product [Rhizophagus irregularis]|nr:unnamed protein product [Rhizophagus irregularis]
MLYEELPSHDYPISQTSQNSMRPLKDYVLKLSITINILIIWSAIQGIISFQIGKNFNSSLLIAFDHYKSTLIHTRNYFDSRKKVENLIVIFGIIIFIILAIITIFIDFYAIKKEKDHPKKPLPPGTIPPFNNHSVSRIPWQLLAFGIYILHPYIALIFTTCQLLFNKWREVIFTLIIALMFVVYAIKLGWTYLQNEKVILEVRSSIVSEIEDLEEE